MRARWKEEPSRGGEPGRGREERAAAPAGQSREKGGRRKATREGVGTEKGSPLSIGDLRDNIED